MGNGYKHQQNMQFNHHKLTFLPILCSKQSTKDVSLPKWQQQDKSGGDPLSPKIGCMGQVKKRRNNKIVVRCPVSHNNGSSIKYFKLKKLFSGKNLTTTATATVTTTTNTTTGSTTSINIENLDPPLPVIKRVVAKQGDNNNNNGETLWQRRRSPGTGLKSLQLQQVRLNRHQEPITV